MDEKDFAEDVHSKGSTGILLSLGAFFIAQWGKTFEFAKPRILHWKERG